MPVYEKTDQGPQALIPGCERREKRRAEIDSAGPLFDHADAHTIKNPQEEPTQ